MEPKHKDPRRFAFQEAPSEDDQTGRSYWNIRIMCMNCWFRSPYFLIEEDTKEYLKEIFRLHRCEEFHAKPE